MYNSGKIIVGIIIFLLFATFPFYNSIGKATAKPEPKIDTPAIKEAQAKLGKKDVCVEPKEFMKAEHMQLLNDWRDAALREGNRLYRASDGRTHDINLQNTCMNCHSNKKKFCDECHNYAAVKPYCWTCHIEPKEERTNE
ncbi:MAG: sulfate reduction electron transfer complex DsrMKJOP subunit DsrJ [Nitrospirota bacterium]